MACWDPFELSLADIDGDADEALPTDEPTAEELEVELTAREGMERAALGLEE